MEIQTLKAEMTLNDKSVFELGTQLEEKNSEARFLELRAYVGSSLALL
jgi:hypothetical protein